MRPLCQLLEGRFVTGGVRPEDLSALEAWSIGKALTLTAPEGAHAGMIRIEPRTRPVIAASERIGREVRQHRVWTITAEGHYASLAVRRDAGSSRWVGCVYGSDFVHIVDGLAPWPFAQRLGRLVCALVAHAALDLGETRPRVCLHQGPAGWPGEVDRLGRTLWRGEGAVITVWPAAPRVRETAAVRLQRRLTGDPLALVRAPDRVRRRTAITTAPGLTGVHLMGDTEDVAILEDEAHRYLATVRGDAAALSAARPHFAALLETVIPVPRPRLASVDETAALHWVG